MTDLNLLAIMADAEARSTAMLVELVAAVAISKLAPPEGEDVRTLEITQGDINEIAQAFHWQAEYDEHGTMKLHLTRSDMNPISGQSPEVTSAD